MSTGDCNPTSGQDLGSTTPIMENLFAESFLNDHVSVTCTSYPTSSTSSTLPTLNEAILEPDMFLVRIFLFFFCFPFLNFVFLLPPFQKNFGISDNDMKEEDNMDIDNIEVVRMGDFPPTKANYKNSPGTTTPTNLSPVITPQTTSPDHQLNKQATDPKFIDQYVGQRLMEEKTKTNTYASQSTMSANAGGVRPPGAHRHFYNGLDTIPEYDVTHTPITFQPLVPPPVPVAKVATTTYNISFPRPLQLRDSFESWRGGQGLYHPFQSNAISSARYSSGTGSSCSSSVPHSPGSSVTVNITFKRHFIFYTFLILYDVYVTVSLP